MNRLTPFCAVIFILFVSAMGCTYDVAKPEPAADRNTRIFLFLGHCYQAGSPHEDNRIDDRIPRIDLKAFDGIILGGDVCTETTKFLSTVDRLDELLHLSEPDVMWTLGNHDVRNGHIYRILEKTERPSYYVYNSQNIVWVVLNTVIEIDSDNLNPCVDMQDQWNMIETVLDTIATADHMVLLMHYAAWTQIDTTGAAALAANANKDFYSFICGTPTKFHTHVYSRLVDVQNRGIDVHVISGDGGQYAKKYSYTSPEGIEFYISGINNSATQVSDPNARQFNFNPDSVLLITHDLLTKDLHFNFTPLDSLVR